MAYSIDSRNLNPGDIFIPIEGPQFDGHAFIPEALKKGARVLDVDLGDYAKKYRKKLKASVIGITGSAGKTTIKDLLYAILSQKYKVVKTAQNQNNEIGTPLTLLQADYTTDIILVEMGMRKKGDLTYLSKIVRPSHVIITSIGVTHIQNFKNQNQLARAKAEIFQPPLEWETEPRHAFINFSSPCYDILQKKATRTGFQVFPFRGESKTAQTANVCHLVGRQFGLTDQEIQAGISTYQPSDHRMAIQEKNGVTLIDDAYNANPDGVQYALERLRPLGGRKILVMGDMLELGEWSKAEHEKIGDWALDAGVSMIFALGPESAHIQSKELPVYHFLNRDLLHRQLKMETKKGDVLLIKGSRGMKMEQTFEFLREQFHG